jgi:hypothetical protein
MSTLATGTTPGRQYCREIDFEVHFTEFERHELLLRVRASGGPCRTRARRPVEETLERHALRRLARVPGHRYREIRES